MKRIHGWFGLAVRRKLRGFLACLPFQKDQVVYIPRPRPEAEGEILISMDEIMNPGVVGFDVIVEPYDNGGPIRYQYQMWREYDRVIVSESWVTGSDSSGLLVEGAEWMTRNWLRVTDEQGQEWLDAALESWRMGIPPPQWVLDETGT